MLEEPSTSSKMDTKSPHRLFHNSLFQRTQRSHLQKEISRSLQDLSSPRTSTRTKFIQQWKKLIRKGGSISDLQDLGEQAHYAESDNHKLRAKVVNNLRRLMKGATGGSPTMDLQDLEERSCEEDEEVHTAQIKKPKITPNMRNVLRGDTLEAKSHFTEEVRSIGDGDSISDDSRVSTSEGDARNPHRDVSLSCSDVEESDSEDDGFFLNYRSRAQYDEFFKQHPECQPDFQEDVNLLEKLQQRIKKAKVPKYFQKNSRTTDASKRLKSQIWSSVVTIVLVEGKNLLACDPDTATSDPYVKFRLGNEKYKSRVVWRSLYPRWLEQFDLHLYDDGDQQLEITVWDKDRSRDDFIGRCVIDLIKLERERTHSLWKELEDGAGSLHILLTISGTTASETISDLTTYEENPREREILYNRYVWHRTFHNVKDVGHLTVKVFRASGLASADIGGKSDPFCVLELGNARLQTQTEYKTLSPCWMKIFTFNVKDINNVLEVTVYDEDRDHKVEFLGKVAIPLLRIRNGEKRWYALKDKKLRARAKGNCPQILLEMNIVWNPIRACIRTLNPKEEKYMQGEVKFKRQVFVKNVLRLKIFLMHFYEAGKIFQNCFEWESKIQSFVALMIWLVLCYYFQPWMIPIGGLLIFLKQYAVRTLTGPSSVPWDEMADSDLEDDDEDDKEKEEKKSLKERLQTIQEVTQGVQNAIGKISSLLEGVKNTFNFTVPYLSWIAIGLLVAATFVLYLIPVRYLLMIWGTNKFLRRLLRPHSVPNNELLDLLSRIPDDEMLMLAQLLAVALSTHLGRMTVFRWYLQLDYKDLKILLTTDSGGASSGDRRVREHQKKKHKTS